MDAQIRQARYDRFLSRVFAEDEQFEWMLKGGMSMLARVPRSRTTKDVDLASLHAADLADAERTLSELVAVELGDHLTFRLIRSIPTGPANRLRLRRPLVSHPYRLYPVVDQIADKVCATVDTNYPGGKRSSRVKDLVDLVVLARTQRVELTELRAAIEAKRVLSGITPFDSFDVPTGWTRTYPSTAKGVPTAENYTAETAAVLVASLVDPAFEKGSNTAIWDPESLTWINSAERSLSGPSGLRTNFSAVPHR